MSSASDAVQLEDRLEKEGPASDYTRKRDLCRLSVAERANGWPTSASETSRASQLQALSRKGFSKPCL